MKNILITGGTGFIGKHLTNLLVEKGFSVAILTRNPKPNTSTISYYKWNIDERYIDEKAVLNADIIINLAGESIVEKHWTNQRKIAILESRTIPIQLIYEVLKKHDKKIESFISASAIGIYGSENSDEVCNEKSEIGIDFLATVCQKWENKVDTISALNIRTVKIRTGLVLGKNGGFLKKMIPVFKYKLGSILGSGKQYMPWIYIDDLCRIYLFSIENQSVSGTYNAVINDWTTNQIFSKTLARIFGYSIWLPKIPTLIIRLFLGKMSTIILNGKPVSSDKLEETGFQFKFKKLENTLKECIKQE